MKINPDCPMCSGKGSVSENRFIPNYGGGGTSATVDVDCRVCKVSEKPFTPENGKEYEFSVYAFDAKPSPIKAIFIGMHDGLFTAYVKVGGYVRFNNCRPIQLPTIEVPLSDLIKEYAGNHGFKIEQIEVK